MLRRNGGPGPTESATAKPAGDANTPAHESILVSSGTEFDISVYPLVRLDDYLLLTVDIVPSGLPEGEDSVSLNRFTAPASSNEPDVRGGALRLVDTAGGHIHLGATDAEGIPVGTDWSMFTIGESGSRVQRLYAAPGGDTTELRLLLPGSYVDEVPVIEATDLPDPYVKGREDDEDYDPNDLPGQVEQGPVFTLEGYTEQLEGAVRTIESTEKVQIDLASDVLFATGSHELSPYSSSP